MFELSDPVLDSTINHYTSLIEWSQLDDKKNCLSTKFQLTLNTSFVCSLKFRMGKSCKVVSQILIDPSPQPVTNWFSWISDHATSKHPSWVSYNLSARPSCNIQSLPFPTIPKFEAVATADLLGKNGENSTY